MAALRAALVLAAIAALLAARLGALRTPWGVVPT
jgi:hypothetical protein